MAAARNKYQALANKSSNNEEDDDNPVENGITSKVDEVVKTALANLKLGPEVKISEGGGKRNCRGRHVIDAAIIGEIVAAVVKSICPLIIEAVDTAAKNIVKLNDGVKAEEVDRQSLLHRYETDRLEQYTRRDNIRIIGMEEGDNEGDDVLEGKLISLAEGMGVELDSGDISVAHRLGRHQGGRQRATIVRFTRRKKRTELLKNKAKLKGKNIFLNQDLTDMRATMLKMVKELDTVKFTSTRDGKITVRLKANPEEIIVIDTLDDLWKLGVQDVDHKRLKLDQFTCAR